MGIFIEQFETLCDGYASELLEGDITQIIGIKDIPSHHNIYGLFIDDQIEYIGKSHKINERLKQHCIKCSESTRSKLEQVTHYLHSGVKVYVKTIEVPTDLMSSIEEKLIELIEPSWNKRK